MPESLDFWQWTPCSRPTAATPACRSARCAVEAGASQGWRRYVGDRGEALCVDRFGASAPGMLRQYGFTVENLSNGRGSLLETTKENP